MVFQRGFLILVLLLVGLMMAAAALRPPAGAIGAPTYSGAHAPRLNDDSGLRPASGPVVANSVDDLKRTFHRAAFSLDTVTAGQNPVPRVFVAEFPHDLADTPDVSDRKAMFFKTMLPLVLKVNEEIRAERRRLWSLHTQQRRGEKLDAVDRLWLIVMAERYRVARGDVDALLARVDAVPVSLTLAQAVEESGWGTSRFAREGNALFGEWTWDGTGIEPLNRDAGKKHRIRAFATLIDSVRSYALNLNRHRAYRGLRKARAVMRTQGETVDSRKLLGHLLRYSERGSAYVEALNHIIDINNLARFDEAKLASL